jgi:eukaryotic-like serine/threonine-protein kinase
MRDNVPLHSWGAPMEATVKFSGSLQFGVFELDLEAGELRKHGIRIRLQEQQFQILCLLVQRPGKLVTREELRHALWPDHTFVDFDRNLNKAINKLRAALCDSAEIPRFIETLHRRGYRFIAPISVPNDGQSVVTPPQVNPETKQPASAFQTAKPAVAASLQFIQRSRYWMTLVAALLVAVSATLSFHQRSAATAGSPSVVKLRRSVAVLGFKNLSARPGEAWVSTALADWLTTDLSAGGQLRVIPPERVARMQIELKPLDLDLLNAETLARIGKNLATDLVVVGAYAVLGQSSNRKVRLDLRLADTATGETLDAISASGTEANLLDLVARTGEELRSKLEVEAVSTREAAEVAVALPSNHKAARLYSEGLENLRVFNALTARDLLEQATIIEPDYALAHASLASAWATLGYDELARKESTKAFELSSNLPRPDRLLVEARYHEMSTEWGKAIDIYRALFEFFPDSLDYGLALANAQFSSARGEDALETVNQLHSLPPPLGEDPRIDLMEARCAESIGLFKRDLAASTRAANKATSIGASLLLADALSEQSWALANLGRAAEASAAANKARRIFAAAGDKRGVAVAIGLTGIVQQNQGDAVTAQKKYEEALATDRQIGNQLGVAAELDDIADTSFALGELERARSYYEQAMATYQEIGHENGVCLVKGAIAPVLMGLGDNRQAIGTAQEAVSMCRRLGDHSKTAIALFSLAKALRQDGRVEDARAAASEAVAIFQDIGDLPSAARARLIIAQTFADEQNGKQAQRIARAAVAEFENQNAPRDEALANAILARASLMTADFDQAQRAIQRATAALPSFHDREVEFVVEISAGRLRAAVPGNVPQAARNLEQVAEEASHLGFVPYEFEPRLALAELEIRSGNLANGLTHLQNLAKEATDHGFGLIAIEAQGDLQIARSTPSVSR